MPGQSPWDPSEVMCWIGGVRAGLAIQQEERDLLKMKLDLSHLRSLQDEDDETSLTRLIEIDMAEEVVARQRATFAALRGGGIE
jgi:hypothetical protein